MAVALVLAAGEGARLGGPKALAEAAGRPLVAWVVEACRQALVTEVVVVAGAESAAVEAAVAALPDGGEEAAPVRVVVNEDWSAGKTGSLQAGWRAVEGPQNALVFPVDHPAVRLVTLDVILGVFGYAAAAPEVIVPVLQDDGGERRRGHPIVLSGKLKEAVLELGPDAPLNRFVREREVLEVPVDDEAILLNCNEPADLEEAGRLLGER